MTRNTSTTGRLGRIVAQAAVGAAAVAGTLAATALPAHATDGYQETSRGDRPGGTYVCRTAGSGAKGCFRAYGETFWLKDTAKDGQSPQIRWSSSTGRSGTIVGHLGAGKWGYVNKAFGESTDITFRVCAGGHGCSTPITTEA